MKLLIIPLLASLLIGCGSETFVEKYSQKQGHNIDSFPEAKAFLVEQVELCGKGVIDATEENKCTHHIEVSGEFLERFQLGLLKDKDDVHEGKQFMMPTEEDLMAVPEAWDMRSLNPAVEQVKIDRQTCGSCWANSSAKLMDLMIAAKDGKVFDLSEQYLVSTCVPTGDCGGGYMTTPDHIIKNRSGGGGMPFEAQDPYTGRNSSCKFSSAEMSKGWEHKLKSAPWVGRSLMHSKGPKPLEAGNTAEMIKALMYKHKSGALVTVSAYDVSGNGIVSSCSFGGTNHMVVITGWGKENGTEFASVWNSWGKGHGLNGISRIKWECGGAGRLNRNLGQEARVYIYEPACSNQPEAITGPNRTLIKISQDASVTLGEPAKKGQTCDWLPKDGIKGYLDEGKCQPVVSPQMTTEYHVTAKTECGEASAMVDVQVLGPKLEPSKDVLTPFGVVKIQTK